MKRYYFVIILLTFSYYASATGKVPSIIPLPSKIIMKEGTFNITPKTLIVIDDQTNGLIEVAHVFIAKLKSLMGTASEVLTFEAGRKYTNVIIFF